MAKRKREPTERELIEAIFGACHALTDLGWRWAMYAPRDSSPLDLIEPGSTGIHRGYCDDMGFWIPDKDDGWPSYPILYRVVAAHPREGE